MRALRPPSYWAVLLGVLVVPGVAARAGLRLFRSVERAPARVEWALGVRVAAANVEGRAADLEASRRGYVPAATAEQVHVLEEDHARVHDAFRALRTAAGPSPLFLVLADSAESAVGAWMDEVASTRPPPDPSLARLRGRRLLDSVRDRVAAVIATAEQEQRAAEIGVRAAHVRASGCG